MFPYGSMGGGNSNQGGEHVHHHLRESKEVNGGVHPNHKEDEAEEDDVVLIFCTCHNYVSKGTQQGWAQVEPMLHVRNVNIEQIY